MTELLMNYNVDRYVSFTGTPYVYYPFIDDKLTRSDQTIEEIIDIVKSGNKIKYEIDCDSVKVDSNDGSEIIDSGAAIQRAFFKDNIPSFYDGYYNSQTSQVNRVQSFSDDNIVKIITTAYQCLLVVGAYFVKYDTNEFVILIANGLVKNNKKIKYIVYVNDSGEKKVYDIETKRFDKSITVLTKLKEPNSFSKDDMIKHTQDSNVFYLIDNSHITGIDFKDYMNLNTRAVMTISPKSILRDVSQALYRLRNINDERCGQSCDYIIEEISYNKMTNLNMKDYTPNCFPPVKTNNSNTQLFSLYTWISKAEESNRVSQEESMILQNIRSLYHLSINTPECYIEDAPKFRDLLKNPRKIFFEKLNKENKTNPLNPTIFKLIELYKVITGLKDSDL